MTARPGGREPQELPLDLGPNGEVRWRAVSIDGRVSPSFKFWAWKQEAYLCQRSLPEIKISLHAEDAHAAFVDHPTLEAWVGRPGSRYLEEWKAPDEFHPGWVELFEVVHPEPELREFEELGVEKVDLVELPVPPDTALHMIVLRNRDPGFATQVTFEDACPVATIHAKDRIFRLIAQVRPWDHDQREWARRARLDESGNRSRSLIPPRGFNRNSPAARLLKLASSSDGSRWYVDLAANEPDDDGEVA